MKRQLFGIIVGVLALVTGIVIYAYGPFYGGKAQAHLDLMRGKYRFRVGPQNSAKFNEIMSKEYGVEIVVIPLPTPADGDELVSIDSCRPCQASIGYNEVMLEALDKRYGHYVLSRVWERMLEDSDREQERDARE